MLSYESAGKVSVSAVRSILDEIGRVERRWWRGVLGLDPDQEGRPSILSGTTALFHPHGVPDEDDVFMAFADATFILGHLAGWSRSFRIKWRIRMYEEDWGAVDPGGYTTPLRDQLQKWARRAGVSETGPLDWAIPEERREALLARYGGRKEV